ncbi:MAG: sensor domain-containing diguanylate cyclase [Terracidiphilus sp.]|jgi:diguanylate cyclase (GGDEF)-like protein/PAS domain S-box-containing protein
MQHTKNAEISEFPPPLRVTTAPTDPQIFKALLDHMSDAVYIAGRDRRVLYCNKAASELTGYEAEEILGKSCSDNGHCPMGHNGRSICEEGCILSESLNDGTARRTKAFLISKQGRRVPASVSVQPIAAADGSIIGIVQIFTDRSQREAARRKVVAMERLAFIDALTQMPNRRSLEMSLQAALLEYKVTRIPFGALLFDLDKLKNINDSYGHANGDHALSQVARILSGALRPTDTVGRWGGDEFLAILPGMSAGVLRQLADRCGNNVARDSFFNIDDKLISLSVSVGGAVVRTQDSPETLIARADSLLYRSKTAGRNCVTIE